MKFDYFKLIKKLPTHFLQNQALDALLSWAIPFNRHLGLHINHLNAKSCKVTAKETRRRKNHVGGAHAGFLALLSEYPAGLILAQNYSPETYRFIISELKIDYHKQGKGTLTATSQAPETFPEFSDGQTFIDMVTEVFNSKNEKVSTCYTKWQVKEWNKVGN